MRHTKPRTSRGSKRDTLAARGSLQAQLRLIGSLPKEERPAFGARVNAAKETLTARVADRRAELSGGEAEARLAAEAVDVSMPGRPLPTGRTHPLSQTIMRVKQALGGLGFEFVDGPELEDYAFNFAALNYPEDHPAFDEQMTFYVDDTRLLRTQTTALQGPYIRQPQTAAAHRDARAMLPVRGGSMRRITTRSSRWTRSWSITESRWRI